MWGAEGRIGVTAMMDSQRRFTMTKNKEFLQQVSDGLLDIQNTVENLEEALEAELNDQMVRAEQCAKANISFNDGDLKGAQVLLNKVNDALVDLACIQEDIGDQLGITPA